MPHHKQPLHTDREHPNYPILSVQLFLTHLLFDFLLLLDSSLLIIHRTPTNIESRDVIPHHITPRIKYFLTQGGREGSVGWEDYDLDGFGAGVEDDGELHGDSGVGWAGDVVGGGTAAGVEAAGVESGTEEEGTAEEGLEDGEFAAAGCEA
jgi:hypothetical protein